MEKFKQFIKQKGWKYNWLAAQLAIETKRFYKIVEGEVNITLAEALKVQDFTDGEFQIRDFLTTKDNFYDKRQND